MDDDPIARQSDIHAARFEVEQLSERVDRAEKALSQRISEEGETTRRHFNIMVEKVEAAVKLVAEVNAHHAVVLDDHEARLKQIERTSSA